MAENTILESILKRLETIHEGEDPDYNFYDYIADEVMSLKYIVDADKRYVAVELCLTFGGPNIFINTNTCELQLFWGSDKEVLPIPSAICEELDDIYFDFYNEAD